jgi:FSR family fosmidomycin resistance protein-like MFS transporter
MPLLGLVADNHGPRGVFIVLATIPLLAIAGSAVLREPAHHPISSRASALEAGRRP